MSYKIHKNTKLTEISRRDIWNKYRTWIKAKDLASMYNVSIPTIYKVIKRARLNDFTIHNSTNHKYRSLQYWLLRLAKIEKKILHKKNNEARRYNKSYPGEMIHIDTKLLPPIKWSNKREYLFVAIDDYTREWYAMIFPDKTQVSSASFLKQVIEQCPYEIHSIMTDNWTEYKWNDEHLFVKVCNDNNIKQVFTKPAHPQTNWKAERFIRTLMDMWHTKIHFKSSDERIRSLHRFLNYYNGVKPHSSLDNLTPFEFIAKFYNIQL